MMRLNLLLPVLICGALLGFSAGDAHAGSFFGPCCYGASYTYQYPNRSHNVFGCGPGYHCQAWHPYFGHGLFRRRQVAPSEAIPTNAMPQPPLPAQPPS
jgi:hypothetical protein